MLNTALAYLRHGWSIFPLQPCSKEPAVLNWKIFQRERATEELARKWWRVIDHNIGLATGVISGVVVVDCDSPDAVAAYLAHADYSPTLCVATGHGMHFYHQTAGFSIRNFGRILPDVDIRGDGGYVVAPPSIHPTGRRYQWQQRIPIQPLPAYILELVKPKPIMRSASRPNTFPAPGTARMNEITARYFNEQCNRIQAAQEGYRNATLFAGAIMAGHFVRDGRMTRFDAESGLAQAALSAGLPEQEVQRTIKSGLERGLNDPRR